MNRAQTDIALRLSERLLADVFETFSDEEGACRVNIDLSQECLLQVLAYLLAFRLELTTPARVQQHVEGIAEQLNGMILRAQVGHDASGVHEHASVSRVVLS